MSDLFFVVSVWAGLVVLWFIFLAPPNLLRRKNEDE
jgi:hypothetical protein